MSWEIGTDVDALLCVKQIASGSLLYSAGSSAQLCDDLEGWDEGGERKPKRKNICVHVADSLCCTAETNHIATISQLKKIWKIY